MDFEIIKIGGSVITDKSGFEAARLAEIKSISKTLAAHFKKGNRFVLVLGAGSFAHPHVLKYGLSGKVSSPAQLEGVQHIHKSVAALAGMVAKELEKHGCKCVYCPAGSLATLHMKNIASFGMAPLMHALAEGKIPITIGDMVADDALGYAPLSGDKILANAGQGAVRAMLVSDTAGVMAGGKTIPCITRTNFLDLESHLGGSKNTDVTGGMRGKVLELLEMESPAIILSCGKNCANLELALAGKECVGTRINC